jgi:thymidylate synthase (FAD)
MGSDKVICNAARVSTSTHEIPEAILNGKDKGLIRYLMRNRHGSPFEKNGMIFYIEAPIFVAREFMRHRHISVNEMSGRYVELKPEFYIPDNNRPLIEKGKVGEYTFELGEDWQYIAVNAAHQNVYSEAWKNYKGMLDRGIAREIARDVLPVGIYTAWYATLNMRAMMHFLSLRTRDERAQYPSGPQYEIELVANEMETYLAEYFTVTHEAFNDFGRVAP